MKDIQLVLSSLCAAILTGCTSAQTSPSSSPPPPQAVSKTVVQKPSLSVDGDMRRVVGVTHIDSPPQDKVSLSRQDQPIGVTGVGEFLALPGRHKLRWQPTVNEAYEVEGQAYIGLRSDSPKFFDFALVVDSVEVIPAAVSAQGQRLRSLNADSVFLSKKFPKGEKVAWLCKIEELPDSQLEGTIEGKGWRTKLQKLPNNHTRFVDW